MPYCFNFHKIIKIITESKYKIINVKHHRRMKRSNEMGNVELDSTINIKISDGKQIKNLFIHITLHVHTNYVLTDDNNLQLNLRRSQNLIDKSFVFISRNQNQSSFIADSFNMAQKYSNCLYRSENSAFDLCDHEIVSQIMFIH